MNETLFYLCRHAVGIMDGWMPFPARCIAQQTGVSLSTARRRLRKLKAEGYATTISEMPNAEGCEYSPPPYHGWTITEKAYETQEYQKALAEEREICMDSFKIDIAPELGAWI